MRATADLMTIFLQVGSLVALLVFVVRYSATSWRRSSAGRAEMTIAVMFLVFIALVLLRMLIPESFGPYIRTCAWAIVFGVWCWRDQLLFRFQRYVKRAARGTRPER